jgi:thioredoxin 1
MAGTNTVIFTDGNFDDQTKDKVSLVDFWAVWCGPCRQQGPIIDKLAEQLKDKSFAIGKMDVDSNPKIAQQFGVLSIPTLVVLKNGQEVKRFVGVQDADTLKKALESA